MVGQEFAGGNGAQSADEPSRIFANERIQSSVCCGANIFESHVLVPFGSALDNFGCRGSGHVLSTLFGTKAVFIVSTVVALTVKSLTHTAF